jgi:hypothetical protein
MRRLFLIGAILGLLVAMASISWAAIKLNSSKSNVYRMVYPTNVVTPTQAAATLRELDQIAPKRDVSEAMLRGALRKQGVPVDRIKKIILRKDGTIIVLEEAADEAQAAEFLKIEMKY